MPPKVKLPEASKEAFAINPALEKILRRQWAVDPAWLKYASPEVLQEISRLQARYESDVAQLESQIQTRYAEFAKEASAIAQKSKPQ